MVSLVNRYDKIVWDTVIRDVLLEIQGHRMVLDFQVMRKTRADVILGQEWLFGLGPSLGQSYLHNSF